jgi:signal transduction histidine kinase
MIVFLLDKTLLSKMERLSLDVRNIGLSGDVSMRIPVAGKDEISSLAGIINNMLVRIDQSEKELQKANDKLDIRVRERTAELETRNEEMERFIYTVSHEIRSPLISASGFAGLLRQDLEKGDSKRTETDLRLIEISMTKMDQLLSEILELSRIGRVVIPPKDVPFDAIAKDALDKESEKLKSRGVEVSVATDLPMVRVDRIRITEVMVNLLENSIKYMGDQAHPKIEIGHRKDEEETVFFVRDNGVGIDPSQHEKVFGLFYRLDPKSEGTGVGLTIVKRTIEVHGGRIWIESELGKGCTVCFTLPLANVG